MTRNQEAARVRTIEAQRAELRERFGFTEADEQRALDRVLRRGAGTPAARGAGRESTAPPVQSTADATI